MRLKKFISSVRVPVFSWRKIGCAAILLATGIAIGGYLFRDVRSRPILEVRPCGRCFGPSELAGFLTSVMIQRAPSILPNVVAETDRSIAIEYPLVTSTRHYTIFPKKDIKDAGDLSSEDQAHLVDIYSVIAKIIRDQQLKDYRIVTNGSGLQDIRYLHFHVYEVKW